jgi:hypothetical protein
MNDQKEKPTKANITEFKDYLDFATRLRYAYEIIEKINK